MTDSYTLFMWLTTPLPPKGTTDGCLSTRGYTILVEGVDYVDMLALILPRRTKLCG